jgi:hypothetical protein
MPQAVMADFGNREDAERAVAQLQAAGVSPGDISVIQDRPTSHTERRRDTDDVTAGALTGAATGGILGGLAGWVLSLGAFDVLGVGRFATENATGATIAGAGIGAALLGLLGGIAGLSFDNAAGASPEEGDVLLTVRSGSTPRERIEQLMRDNNALNVQNTDDIPEPAVAPGSMPHTVPETREPVANHDSAAGTPMVQRGQDVYTLDNKRLGEVGDPTGDYFIVRRGLLQADLFIPFEDVHEIRPERVTVNAVGNEVELKNWREQPLHRGHHGEGPTRP